MRDADDLPRHFATTRWSLVRAAAKKPTAESREALSRLCVLYRYPIYAFVRRGGATAEDAQDLTQGFFADLLHRNDLGTADRERGRFRTWLLACVKHFLANARAHDHALKRGGGVAPISIDAEAAEGAYKLEPSHDLTPERLYERRWTLSLLERVLAMLKAFYVERGNEALFEKLQGTLVGEAGSPYATIAAGLGMTEGAVKVAVFRFRQKYAELLRGEVADTIDNPDDVDDEIRRLCGDL